MLFAVLLVLECTWLPETLYPRTLVVTSEQRSSPIGGGDVVSHTSVGVVKKTKQLAWLKFQKVPGLTHPKPYVTAAQFCMIWSYPTIVISTLAYVFFHYWW